MISLNLSGALPGSQPGIRQGQASNGLLTGAEGSGQGGLDALFSGLLASLAETVTGQAQVLPAAAETPATGHNPALDALMQSLAQLDRESLEPDQQQLLDELMTLWQDYQAEPGGDAAVTLTRLLEAAGLTLPTPPAQATTAAVMAPGTQPVSSSTQSATALSQPANPVPLDNAVPRSAQPLDSAMAGGVKASPDLDVLALLNGRVATSAATGPGGDTSSQKIELLQSLISRLAAESGHRSQAPVPSITLDNRPDSGLGLSGASTPAQWAPVRVDSAKSQWSQDLMAALGDRLSMQVNQQVKEATVRLDPPDLGRVDLTVRMDGDRLNVQLNATNPMVRDLLVQHAERLRTELLEQNLQTVDVHVGTGDGGQQRQEQPMETVIAGQPQGEEAERLSATEQHENRWLSTSA